MARSASAVSACPRDGSGRLLQRSQFGSSVGGAGAQVGLASSSLGGTKRLVVQLGRQGVHPGLAGSLLAARVAMGSLGCGLARAGGGQRGAGALHAGTQFREVGQAGTLGLQGGECCCRFIGLWRDVGQLRLDRGKLGGGVLGG